MLLEENNKWQCGVCNCCHLEWDYITITAHTGVFHSSNIYIFCVLKNMFLIYIKLLFFFQLVSFHGHHRRSFCPQVSFGPLPFYQGLCLALRLRVNSLVTGLASFPGIEPGPWQYKHGSSCWTTRRLLSIYNYLYLILQNVSQLPLSFIIMLLQLEVFILHFKI